MATKSRWCSNRGPAFYILDLHDPLLLPTYNHYRDWNLIAEPTLFYIESHRVTNYTNGLVKVVKIKKGFKYNKNR